MAGNYGIFNCGDHAAGLVTLLETLRSTLQLVLGDLNFRRSSKAFTTFFKHVNNVPYVRSIIQNIALGNPVSIDGNGHRNFPGFICVTAREQVWVRDESGETVDFYEHCLQRPRTAATSDLTSSSRPMTILCPLFFKSPAIPPSSRTGCLGVDPATNAFISNGAHIINFQLWHIMHELVHMYIYWSSGGRLDFYHVNDCLSLSANQSVQNAQSYAFYAASALQIFNPRDRCKDSPANSGARYPSWVQIVPT